MYYSVKPLKQNRTRTTKMYLEDKDRKEIISECGDAAYILMEYYVEKGGIPEFEYTDEKAAFNLGWSNRKVKDIRLKLQRAEYYLKVKGKLSTGAQTEYVFLGRDNVIGAKRGDAKYSVIKESNAEAEDNSKKLQENLKRSK